MGTVILPTLDKIQLLSTTFVLGRYEVYPYTDKFTGEAAPGFLAELDPYGRPFLTVTRNSEDLHRSIYAVENNLFYYLKQAFHDCDLEFRGSEGQLTLAVVNGLRIDFNAPPVVFAEKDRHPLLDSYSLERKVYTRPAQFFQIRKKICDLE
jgi:hypothetical protein